jgi:hypothetical protein
MIIHTKVCVECKNSKRLKQFDYCKTCKNERKNVCISCMRKKEQIILCYIVKVKN